VPDRDQASAPVPDPVAPETPAPSPAPLDQDPAQSDDPPSQADDGVEDPAGVLDEYDPEHLAAATQIVRDLAARQKKVPHVNAANFLVHSKAGLPKVTTAQIAAMLAGTEFAAS